MVKTGEGSAAAGDRFDVGGRNARSMGYFFAEGADLAFSSMTRAL
jgi:hypothetical protein